MILWVGDRFRNLSRYHYAVIVVTIFVPLILGLVVAYPAFECLVVRVIVYVGVFLVWALFVVVAVALLAEKDVSGVQHLVSQHTEPLAEQVNRVREEHDGRIEDLRSQFEDLESRTRATFERLDVNLPPRSVNVRFGVTSGAPEVSFTVRRSGGSRWRRFRRWVRRGALKVWQVVYGKKRDG